MREDEYEIVVVRYGTATLPRSRMFLNDFLTTEVDSPQQIDYFLWLARNDVRTVVVDTGFAPHVGARRGRSLVVDPLTALEALGAGPAAAPTVVVTHMHYDHIGNLDAFTGSSIVLAAAEYDFWTSPRARHAQFAHLVEPAEVAAVVRARGEGRVELVDGEHTVAPGITVIPVGGHTAGQSMVLVATPGGPHLLTSDVVHFREELEHDRPFVHMDHLSASYDAYDRIRSMTAGPTGARLLLGHEPGEFDRLGPAVDPALPAVTRVVGHPVREAPQP